MVYWALLASLIVIPRIVVAADLLKQTDATPEELGIREHRGLRQPREVIVNEDHSYPGSDGEMFVVDPKSGERKRYLLNKR